MTILGRRYVHLVEVAYVIIYPWTLGSAERPNDETNAVCTRVMRASAVILSWTEMSDTKI